jgi:hypothetical protein
MKLTDGVTTHYALSSFNMVENKGELQPQCTDHWEQTSSIHESPTLMDLPRARVGYLRTTLAVEPAPAAVPHRQGLLARCSSVVGPRGRRERGS